MNRPAVTIVIPSRDRPQALRACLEALAVSVDARSEFEVLIVDDGSREPVDSVVAAVEPRIPLSLIRQDGSGPASARNTGARNAAGELLTFLDDDCLPTPGWLEQLTTACGTRPRCLAGGRTVNALNENSYSDASQVLIDYLYRYYNADPDCASFVTSNNMAMPRRDYLEMGGMNESFPRAAAEDRDFCDRWLMRGWPIVYTPDAEVRHAHTMTFTGFFRTHFNYGRGAWTYHQLRRSRGRPPFRLEPPKFYGDLMAYAFQKRDRSRRMSLSVLLFLTQVANSLGFFMESLSSNFGRGAEIKG